VESWQDCNLSPSDCFEFLLFIASMRGSYTVPSRRLIHVVTNASPCGFIMLPPTMRLPARLPCCS